MKFYTEITTADFLNKVKNLMEDEEFPYELPEQIEKDLNKVNFNRENYTDFTQSEGFSNYPVGYRELKPNFHTFFVNAGGDWEFPICFIFYWGDGKLRAYIPKDGNAWSKKEKCAYVSEDRPEVNNPNWEEKEIDESRMIVEIIKHIIKK